MAKPEVEDLLEFIDLIDRAEANVLKLERGHDAEYFNALMRSLHGLKGACGFFDLTQVSDICHDLETLCLAQETKLASQTDHILEQLEIIRGILNLDDETIRLPSKVSFPSPSENNAPGEEQKSSLYLPDDSYEYEWIYEQDLNCSDLKVMVIDDELLILELIKDELEEVGASVDGHLGLASASSALVSAPLPDGVIIDLNLKDATGIELLEGIQRLAPDIPMFIITGNVSRDVLAQSLESGARAAVEKPLELPELRAIIRQIRRSKRSRQTLKAVMNVVNQGLKNSDDLARLEEALKPFKQTTKKAA